MKMLTLFVFLFGMVSHSICQITIGSFPISVCVNKTSNLIFSYPIIAVDRGSTAIIAQKAKGAENVLQLKADKENFHPTNLSVITSDGKLFSFLVSYSPDPPALNVSFPADSSAHLSDHQIQLTAERLDDAILTEDASVIGKQKHFLHQQVSSEGIRLRLCGVYIKDQLLWFTFEIMNNSFLDYNPDYLRCYIQDKTKTARSAIQETEVPVLYPKTLIPPVPGKKKKHFALAFAPFTFSGNKKMVVEISEKNGGRLLMLSADNKETLKARPIK
jgi:conjugative transposon TraN protein